MGSFIVMFGVVLLMVGLSLYLARPDKKWIGLSVIGVGIALWLGMVVLHLESILRYLLTRRGRLSTNALLSCLFFVGVLAILVYISDRHNASWDWTKTKRHTLSPQTLKIVRSIDKEVNVVAFYDLNSQEFVRVRDLLKRYEAVNRKSRCGSLTPSANLLWLANMKWRAQG
jgi:ABC-type uncharacterized transport system involved in gliding motility auxiliary subunit